MKRVAAIYDIHGNLPALEAVWREIEGVGVDHIVVGGDAVGGPMPVGVLDLLMVMREKVPMSFLHGNGESELLRYIAGEPVNGLSPVAEEVAAWVVAKLGEEHVAWLREWVLSVKLNVVGREVLFCHAVPESDTPVFTKQTAESKVLPFFAGVEADVVVCGHTHMQFKRRVGGIDVVNAGSVGMPFGGTGAYWLLIDEECQFQHTVYDLEGAAVRVRATDYLSADAFAAQNVLTTPSEADALLMLSRLAVGRS